MWRPRFALFLALAVLLIWIAGTALASGEGGLPDAPASAPFALYDPAARYAYGQLTDAQRVVFARLYDGVASFAEEIAFATPCPAADMQAAYLALVLDCPELFQLDEGRYTAACTPDGSYVSIAFGYRMYEALYESELSQVTAILAGFRSLPDFGTDDYRRELAIYRYLIDHVAYGEDDPSCAQADGAYLNGSAQCSGYTRALNLALRYYGIPCAEVVGTAVLPDEDGSAPHSWSLVRINGNWYDADLTWDDGLTDAPRLADGEPMFLPYFNITGEQALRTRTVNGALTPWALPSRTATRDNYYVRCGWRASAGTDAEKALYERLLEACENGWRTAALSVESADGFAGLAAGLNATIAQWTFGDRRLLGWSYAENADTGLLYLYDLDFIRR